MSSENMTLSMDLQKWHFEHEDTPNIYCCKKPSLFEGFCPKSARDMNSTQNPIYVSCPRCLKKMKQNGIVPLTWEEIVFLTDLMEKGSLPMSEDETELSMTEKLCHSGHICSVEGFDNNLRLYICETGLNCATAQRKYYYGK